nr:hypothetical protein [Candidatus Brocadiales bacterium]
MNNKQIEMTTAMPSMKKSLLALAVAGTMATSGGVMAGDTPIAGAASTTGTVIAASETVSTVADGKWGSIDITTGSVGAMVISHNTNLRVAESASGANGITIGATSV